MSVTPLFSLSKNPFGLFRQFFAVCCAHNLFAFFANKFHTCSLRSIFAHVHVTVENDYNFIRRKSGELCEAILQSETPSVLMEPRAFF